MSDRTLRQDLDYSGVTQIHVATGPSTIPGTTASEWVHSLRVVEGSTMGRRQRVGSDAVGLGRNLSNALVLQDSAVSGSHCRVRSIDGDTALEVADPGSTNGTFIDGERVTGTGRLRDGGLLQVGRHVLLHEFRSRQEMERAEQADRDLERARHYVMSLLPAPIEEGPVRTEWFFRPSATLGGDAFGYLQLDGGQLAGYVIDVSDHGPGVAMHAVTIMNVLRQRALPDTDFADPAQVLNRLNGMFQMDRHDDLCFTMWYGVYDPARRELAFASAGHHPAFLRRPAAPALQPLSTRSLMVGALTDTAYRADRVAVPDGSRLYIFSDGLFELSDRSGRQWSLADLMPYLEQSDTSPGEPERLYRAVRQAAGDGPLEDDCSIVTVTFL